MSSMKRERFDAIKQIAGETYPSLRFHEHQHKGGLRWNRKDCISLYDDTPLSTIKTKKNYSEFGEFGICDGGENPHMYIYIRCKGAKKQEIMKQLGDMYWSKEGSCKMIWNFRDTIEAENLAKYVTYNIHVLRQIILS